MRRLVAAALTVALTGGLAAAGPAAEARPKPTEAQKRADRHFKNGVALFGEGKYGEALAEFERAHDIAPHPLVLYNIAASYRELSRYGEAVRFYGRFLAEAEGVAPPARLEAARRELAEILGRVAQVTITVEPPGIAAEVEIDGAPIDLAAQPVILPPGEHRVRARAAGRRDAARTLRIASGDEVAVALSLEAEAEPAGEPTASTDVAIGGPATAAPDAGRRRFALSASAGINLLRIGETGAPALGLAVALGDRLELGVDVVLVAFAVVPTVRARLLGDRLALLAVAAAPIARTDDDDAETFVAGAAGLALRWRPSAALAFRLEGWASYAGAAHGTTLPAFVGGELWF
jgi:hypothetical protein